ncbi:kinesin motor domain-containing protein [Choanephora cucurbitarum]|nr:kinesin motor domain-containing protein [Choanephora cucurbitarum]
MNQHPPKRIKRLVIPDCPPAQQRTTTMRSSMNSNSSIRMRPIKRQNLPKKKPSPVTTVSVEKETNIQVVLRCKGPPHPTASTVLEHIDTEHKAQVMLTTNKIAYTFDRVFKEEASQQEVYQNVAEPILEDVLKGYSCTIFAYGQTGTGKTYTMEGDLGQTDKTTAASNAGVIPRTIYNLFRMLDNREAYVTVSMLELYNEELRDLLSAENDSTEVKILDNGSSVIVKGVKDHPITSAANGLEIMKRGVKKRMTAATNCNEKSSRSHCIFTITVNQTFKRTTGEEMILTGKLNLVDLAGSENSRTSGSEHIRAREAANINRSLLTLGRVINCLVDQTQHIPYRESKLTRLLKDSLGGRTKTCIIATVAPGQQSQEEIRSTLDYASHAKGICNRPESNMPLSREVHLASLTETIRQLQDELRNNYEKNGVFQTKKQYDDQINKLAELKEQVQELQKQNEAEKRTATQAKMEARYQVQEINQKLAETEELLQQNKADIKSLRLENEQKDTKLRQYEADYRALEDRFRSREQQLIRLAEEKEAQLRLEIETIEKKHQESIASMIDFHKDLHKEIDHKWSTFMSTVSSTKEYDEPSIRGKKRAYHQT